MVDISKVALDVEVVIAIDQDDLYAGFMGDLIANPAGCLLHSLRAINLTDITLTIEGMDVRVDNLIDEGTTRVMDSLLQSFFYMFEKTLLVQVPRLLRDTVENELNHLIDKYLLSKEYHCPPYIPPPEPTDGRDEQGRTPYEVEQDVIEHLPSGTSLVKWADFDLLNQARGLILNNLRDDQNVVHQIDDLIKGAVGAEGVLGLHLNKQILSTVSKY